MDRQAYTGYSKKPMQRRLIIFVVSSMLLVWILLLGIFWIYEAPKRLILRQTFRRNTKL